MQPCNIPVPVQITLLKTRVYVLSCICALIILFIQFLTLQQWSVSFEKINQALFIIISSNVEDEYVVLGLLVGPMRRKRQAMSYIGTHTVCRLVVVADYYFFQNLGQSDRRTTGEYIVINLFDIYIIIYNFLHLFFCISTIVYF